MYLLVVFILKRLSNVALWLLFYKSIACTRKQTTDFQFFSGVRYSIAKDERWNCHQVCRSHNLKCTARNHGFTDDNILMIFQTLGVACRTEKVGDMWEDFDEPVYGGENSTWRNKCIGWRSIPPEIKCDESPHRKGTYRLCPCVVGKKILKSLIIF